jgi:hypothetical protein
MLDFDDLIFDIEHPGSSIEYPELPAGFQYPG